MEQLIEQFSFLEDFDKDSLTEDNLEEFEGLSDEDKAKVEFFLEQYPRTSLERALDNLDSIDVFYEHSLSDLAEEFYDGGYFGEINEYMKPFINFEAVGRDLEIRGYTLFKSDVLGRNVICTME